MKNSLIGILLFLSLFISSGKLLAYSITTFGPDVFTTDTAAMDAILGVSGLIEDFEDTTLIPGLSVNNLNISTRAFYEWDGSRVHHTQFSTDVFTIAGGTDFFAVSLSSSVPSFGGGQILINGNFLTAFSSLPNFVSVDIGRNVYIKIRQESGDAAINTVTFERTLNSADDYGYDHLALNETSAAIPEPHFIGILGFAFLTLILGRHFRCLA